MNHELALISSTPKDTCGVGGFRNPSPSAWAGNGTDQDSGLAVRNPTAMRMRSALPESITLRLPRIVIASPLSLGTVDASLLQMCCAAVAVRRLLQSQGLDSAVGRSQQAEDADLIDHDAPPRGTRGAIDRSGTSRRSRSSGSGIPTALERQVQLEGGGDRLGEVCRDVDVDVDVDVGVRAGRSRCLAAVKIGELRAAAPQNRQ